MKINSQVRFIGNPSQYGLLGKYLAGSTGIVKSIRPAGVHVEWHPRGYNETVTILHQLDELNEIQ